MRQRYCVPGGYSISDSSRVLVNSAYHPLTQAPCLAGLGLYRFPQTGPAELIYHLSPTRLEKHLDRCEP